MFVYGTDPVGISIRDQTGIAPRSNYGALRHLDVWQNRLRIDHRNGRIDLVADLDVWNARTRKDSRNHPTARAVHAIDQKPVSGGANRIEINKPRNRSNVIRVEIDRLDRRRLCCLHQWLVQITLDGGHDRRLTRTTITGLVFDAVPLSRIVARGDHHAARSLALTHRVRKGRGRG